MTKTALVTGASAGLGAEYAKLFAARGDHLIVVARREDRLNALADELRQAHGVDVHVIAADLSRASEVQGVFDRTKVLQTDVDYLVNNAGFGQTGAFIENDLDGALGQISVNIAALTQLCGLYAPTMIARKSGRILNIASTAGFQPGPFMAVYYATKAYVISLSEALAVEFKGTGVTVTAHCPGATATEFSGIAGNDKSALFKKGSVASAEACARHGLKAMDRGEALSIHGFTNKVLMQSNRISPRAVVRHVTAALNKPQAS